MSFCKKMKLQGDDPYHIDEESDSDDEMGYKSSDDELEISNHLLNEADTESEDDFEKEMQNELNESLKLKVEASNKETLAENIATTASNITQLSNGTTESNGESATNGATASNSAKVYDEDYFSSGSEDNDTVGGIPSKSKQRREVLTNDELFYDPDMDDEDEKWVTNQRQQNANKSDMPNTKKSSSSTKSKSKVQKVPTSDAILSCPACMSTLSIDCQRHEIYKSQYRAMFVMNCDVIKDEVLKYQEQRHKNIGKRKGKQKGKLVPENMERQSSSEDIECEIFNPVKCSECGTEVAVFDRDEVYHFFNVLTSYA